MTKQFIVQAPSMPMATGYDETQYDNVTWLQAGGTYEMDEDPDDFSMVWVIL